MQTITQSVKSSHQSSNQENKIQTINQFINALLILVRQLIEFILFEIESLVHEQDVDFGVEYGGGDRP